MIAYVEGTVEYAQESMAVIDVGGVGMNVIVSGDTLSRLPAAGENVRLYTYMSVREDAIVLYGFLSREEQLLFRQLIGVSGIGPKGAQAILSVLPPDELRFAVASGDVRAISRAPGIGKKTAERLVLELRDRISTPDISEIVGGGATAGDAEADPAAGDAVLALTALGYGRNDAVRAVNRAFAAAGEDEKDTETILKLALKELI